MTPAAPSLSLLLWPIFLPFSLPYFRLRNCIVDDSTPLGAID